MIDAIKSGKKRGRMMFLPARPGTCAMCARDHASELAHDYQSVFYQMRFKAKWGRDATHDDTIAHLTPEQQSAWRHASDEVGVKWTSHPDPIAEPYAESTGGR
jgi:hypothetical protein